MDSTATSPRFESPLLERMIWLLRRRPTFFYSVARQYGLFQLSHMLLALHKPAGVTLGHNVRLQRLRSVMAEAPDATVALGDNCIVYEDCRLESYGQGAITIGADSVLGGCKIACRSRVTIGKRFLCSWNVFIQDFDPHPTAQHERALQVTALTHSFRPRFGAAEAVERSEWHTLGRPIAIGDDVWVGAGATVLKGASIGEGSIVAAGAVVPAKEFGPRSLIAGNPAAVVRELPY